MISTPLSVTAHLFVLVASTDVDLLLVLSSWVPSEADPRWSIVECCLPVFLYHRLIYPRLTMPIEPAVPIVRRFAGDLLPTHPTRRLPAPSPERSLPPTIPGAGFEPDEEMLVRFAHCAFLPGFESADDGVTREFARDKYAWDRIRTEWRRSLTSFALRLAEFKSGLPTTKSRVARLE